MADHAILCPKMEYSPGTTTFTKEEIKKIQTAVIITYKPRLG